MVNDTTSLTLAPSRIMAEIVDMRQAAGELAEAARNAIDPKSALARIEARATELERSAEWLAATAGEAYVEQADTLNETARSLEGLAGLISTTTETLPEDELAKGLDTLGDVARLNARTIRLSATSLTKAASAAREGQGGGE